MQAFRWLFVSLFLLGGTLPSAELRACSLAPTSLHEYFSRHSRVFYGEVEGEASKKDLPADTYSIRVHEAFKGFSTLGDPETSIPVTFSIRTHCGFDAPKKGDRVLVFMNDGDVVSSTSGTRFVWQESAQPEPYLNPSMDALILLRAFINPRPPNGVVPDEATAIHIALKALLPIVGREELKKQWPLVATRSKRVIKEYDGVDWRVQGVLKCKAGSPECPKAPLSVECGQWSGEVVRVRSGDKALSQR